MFFIHHKQLFVFRVLLCIGGFVCGLSVHYLAQFEALRFGIAGGLSVVFLSAYIWFLELLFTWFDKNFKGTGNIGSFLFAFVVAACYALGRCGYMLFAH
jgi:drug/metabolite transporter (DMT)-like permease